MYYTTISCITLPMFFIIVWNFVSIQLTSEIPKVMQVLQNKNYIDIIFVNIN